MDIYTGFVYIWYDRKRKWFCIGSHMGSLDDGYTSSTGFMDSAIKKRPHDFKRRILEFYYGNDPKELFALEQKYLDMIKDEELCLGENKHNGTIRYYNVKKNASGLSGRAASVLKKQFWDSNRGAERKKIMSKEMQNNNFGSFRINRAHTEESKQKITDSKKGKKSTQSSEDRSNIMKDLWQQPDFIEKMKNRKGPDPEKTRAFHAGRKRTNTTKNNISESLKGKPKSDEHKDNLKKAAKTRKPFTCPHCGFQGRGGHRYHFNNCKHKKEE